MTISEFLEELRDILQRDTAVSADDVLEDLEEWDSMAIMACLVCWASSIPTNSFRRKRPCGI